MLKTGQRLAIFMEGAVTGDVGKMAVGIIRYSPHPVACVIDSTHAGQTMDVVAGLPKAVPIVASVAEAVALHADAFVLGIAPPGGLIPESWYPAIDAAYAAGLCIVNGLHDLLGPRYAKRATPPRPWQWVWDIRMEPAGLKPGTGRAAHLANRRLLMIGTDMAVGKMTAGLEIYRLALESGQKCAFVATGQIGITITGTGIPLDAIRVDFAAGAVEQAVVDADADLVIIEGQGALIHPGSSANLPLLRGSCPTHLVLCARAGQTHLARVPEIAIPPLGDYIRLYENLASACGTFPQPVTVGVALNTFALTADEAERACTVIESELKLPVVDPVRHGAQRLLAALG